MKSSRSSLPLVVRTLAVCMVLGACALAHAQAVSLSREDRLAILYTSQLPFAPNGEPLIKVGLAEGLESARFSASTSVVIQPLGDGGSTIEVPTGRTFTVSLSDGEAGTYSYAVRVDAVSPGERDAAYAARALWESRGYAPEFAHVGSIFAVAGHRFDTRKTLVLVGETADRSVAEALAAELQSRFGADAVVHAELDDYPGGMLELSGIASGVSIRHRDLLWVRGTADTVFTVRDVPYDVGTRYEGREDRAYVGSLVFTVDREGRLAVVNETTLERLVSGIVPAEVYTSAPEAALQAQAVAARSEVLAGLGVRHLADPYLTCSDQRCQVYRGTGYENARTTRATEATAGRVLAWGDQIIDAKFSANNGGIAGANAATWGGEQRAYLHARVDTPESGAAPHFDAEQLAAFLADPPDVLSNIQRFGGNRFRWEETMSAAALSEAVARRYEGVGRVEALEVLSRGPSGRVTQMRIAGDEGEVVVERELNVRRAFGGLYSALFVLRTDTAADGTLTSATFVGGGFGHGVGMCQTGAVGAADRGWSFERILAHYYPGTELRALY